MSASARREQQRTAFREDILAAAREIAKTNGWQAVTLRGVAGKLDYSAAALYEYFPSKNAILQALLANGFAQLADLITASQNAGLEAVAEAYFDFALENSDLYQVMHGLGGISFGTPQTPPEAAAAFAALRGGVADCLPNSDAEGLDEAADAFWATLHGIVSLTMEGRIKGGAARARHVLRRAVAVHRMAWQAEPG